MRSGSRIQIFWGSSLHTRVDLVKWCLLNASHGPTLSKHLVCNNLMLMGMLGGTVIPILQTKKLRLIEIGNLHRKGVWLQARALTHSPTWPLGFGDSHLKSP